MYLCRYNKNSKLLQSNNNIIGSCEFLEETDFGNGRFIFFIRPFSDTIHTIIINSFSHYITDNIDFKLKTCLYFLENLSKNAYILPGGLTVDFYLLHLVKIFKKNLDINRYTVKTSMLKSYEVERL
mmetsp:Transcript_17966/g.26922  ORF Transcript_17966/g.26922 Transcript_17966/m.26922 type:complete len:126 (+) Transcript_17966:846-1223(+)